MYLFCLVVLTQLHLDTLAGQDIFYVRNCLAAQTKMRGSLVCTGIAFLISGSTGIPRRISGEPAAAMSAFGARKL
jgi:hypothetical protein